MAYFIIPEAAIFEVRGKDAARYLQARLSNDIRALTPNQSCLAAALTPQGKTEALFTVSKRDDGSFLLYTDGGSQDDSLSALKRYLVADQVTVADCSATHGLLHATNRPLLARILNQELPNQSDFSTVSLSTGTGTLISRPRTRQQGVDIIAPKDAVVACLPELHDAKEDELSDEMQILERYFINAPIFPREIPVGLLFPEAGLERALSFRKGCYAGQEVIEKVSARGKPPRLLRRLIADAAIALTPGSDVLSGDKLVGNVISSAVEGARTYCFAYLKNSSEAEMTAFTIAGISAHLLIAAREA